MQALNSHPDVYIAPEMGFQHPLKTCLLRDLKKFLSGASDPYEVLCFVRSRNYKDTYSEIVSRIDEEVFVECLRNIEHATELDVFHAIIRSSSPGRGRVGAKFPVHYSYGEQLLRYFPECKIVYLTRDPRDIYCSDLVMKTRRFEATRWSTIIKFLLSPVLALYTIYKWDKSLALFDKWESEFGSDRIRLFMFEDIGSDEDKVLASLANFVGIDGSSLSLEKIRVVDSSFIGSPTGRRWESRLSSMGNLLFEVLAGRRMASMGYRRRGEDVGK